MKQPTSKASSSSSSVGSGKNDPPDGFKSKRKRHVDKDPELLKRLEAVVASGGAGGESFLSSYGYLSRSSLVLNIKSSEFES